MAKKKSTRGKSKSRDPERSIRNKRLAIGSLLIAATGLVLTGSAMGLGYLDRTAAELIVPTNPEVIVHWATLPDGSVWLPLQDQEHLYKSIARSVQGGKALSQEPLKEASITLSRSGWVNGIPVARWNAKGQIEIDADWRSPAAAVRVGQREIVIDWNRMVLPPDYAIGESNQFYFLNPDGPMPRVGEQWTGTNLHDGINLLRELRRAGISEQIAGFDLGRGEDSGNIKIITTRATTIVWGAGPGRERPGEKPTQVKINRLRALYERAGLIDGGTPYIDIRGADIMADENTPQP